MLFNERYKVYLDIVVDGTEDNWFRCYPETGEISKKPFGDELFTRFEFGEFEFKNNPDLYIISPINSYKTYDLLYNFISENNLSQEIRIKIVPHSTAVAPDTLTSIIGYFGVNDCEFDNDKKIVRVTPTILDVYTDFVEYYETEVDIIGEDNTFSARWDRNQDYNELYPSGLTGNHIIPVQKTFSSLQEGQSPTGESGYTSAFIAPCLSDYQADITIGIDVSLTLTETAYFHLTEYKSNGAVVVLASESFSISGGYWVNLYYSGIINKGSYIVLHSLFGASDTAEYQSAFISLSAVSSTFTTFDITLNVDSDYLVNVPVWSIEGGWGARFVKRATYNSMISTLDDFFETTGEPKSTLLTDTAVAPQSMVNSLQVWVEPNNAPVSINGLFLTDITTLLEPFGYELSECTVYKGIEYYNWDSLSYRIPVYCTAVYSRFEAWMDDAITSPTGTGWTAHPTIINNGKILWTKKPFGGTITTWTKGTIETSSTLWWTQKLTSSRKVNYPLSGNSATKPGRSLKDVIKSIVNGTHPTFATSDITSVFLFGDSDPDLTDTTDYFADKVSTLQDIACIHTYQFQDPNENSKDSELKISFKSFWDEFNKLFNKQLFWFIDSNYDVHIEHIKYKDLTKSYLDITTGTVYTNNVELLKEISKWNYEKSKMFSLTTWKVANAGYKDFTDNKITFPKIVSNKRGEDLKQEYSLLKLTTDLRYCAENPADLDNGLLLVQYDSSNTSVNAYVPVVQSVVENGNLALSNLIKNFAYEGVFSQGEINGTTHDFAVTLRTKSGKEFILKGIFDYDFFKTVLGVGMIDSVTYNLGTATLEIKLKYRYESDTESDVFELMVSMVGDYDGAENVLFDFG